MPRQKPARRLKLEAFWRAHLKGWRDSNLNQREYCELHGLPLKRFGNWRAEFKNEQTIVPNGLLWRRGGGDRTGARPCRQLSQNTMHTSATAARNVLASLS